MCAFVCVCVLPLTVIAVYFECEYAEGEISNTEGEICRPNDRNPYLHTYTRDFSHWTWGVHPYVTARSDEGRK